MRRGKTRNPRQMELFSTPVVWKLSAHEVEIGRYWVQVCIGTLDAACVPEVKSCSESSLFLLH